MNIVLCESSDKPKYNAAKARLDALEIAKKSGYRHIVLFHNGYWKPYIMFELFFGCIRTICLAGKGDNVFIQYPYYPDIVRKIFFLLMSYGKKIKGFNVIMLLHDVNFLRKINYKAEQLRTEIQAWSWCDQVICHNYKMIDKLRETHPYNKYSSLGIFDYLYTGSINERHYRKQPSVVIAGDLSPQVTGFLYQIPAELKVRFRIYGPHYAGTTANIEYCGKYAAEELIMHLDGQFGLVWYGDSCDTCSGNIGGYLPYICPHKFSLYIAAGIPVIVWRNSALAEFVVTKNIGLAIDSLFELEEKLLEIDEQKYQTMLKNVLDLRKDVVEGKHLSSLL